MDSSLLNPASGDKSLTRVPRRSSVVGPLKALAAATGNDDLAAQIDFTRSDFMYGRDNHRLSNPRNTTTAVCKSM